MSERDDTRREVGKTERLPTFINFIAVVVSPWERAGGGGIDVRGEDEEGGGRGKKERGAKEGQMKEGGEAKRRGETGNSNRPPIATR